MSDMYIQSFKDLVVWQKAIDVVFHIYRLTEQFPRNEIFGLTSQMRRASIAIPSNIAEGKKRKTIRDYVQFLRIADGSAAELETQIIISKKLYPNLEYSQADSVLSEVQKMLTVIIHKLEKR